MVICAISSVTLMPLGDAMTLLFTAPFSTMVIAAFFLGHRMRLYRILCALLLIGGAVFVIRPSFIFDHLSLNVRSDPITKSFNNSPVILFNQGILK